jgi:hypothetical protein
VFSLQTHVIICVSFFAAMIAVAMGGNALQAAGVVHDLGALRTPFLILIFILFLGFGFSAIPVMVKIVLGFQRQLGNKNVPAVAAALRAENRIIYAIWALLAAGLVVAIPAAIKGGLFDPPGIEPAGGSVAQTASDGDFGATSGTLVARPGMLMSQMVHASSLAIDPARQSTWTGSVVGGQVFDFHIAGTNIVFPRCRYYFVAPYTREPRRIESINIGVSPSAIGPGELERSNASLRQKLAADGWLAGHEEYRGEEDRTLHGGASRGPEGSLWLKNGIVLRIGARRIDDAVEGEHARTAGRWIQFVDLWQHDDYPNIERYAFAPQSK